MEELNKLLSIYQPSWLSREIPEGWSLPMWHPFARRAGKKIWKMTGLSAWPWCQQRLWKLGCHHTGHAGQAGDQPSQRGLLKAGPAGSACSPSVTCSLGEGKDAVCLDFSKAFDCFQCIVLESLAAQGSSSALFPGWVVGPRLVSGARSS